MRANAHVGGPNLLTSEGIYQEQGNSEKAKDLYARALAIREQVLGRYHPKTTETRTRLIALFHALGQHEEAAHLEVAQPEP